MEAVQPACPTDKPACILQSERRAQCLSYGMGLKNNEGTDPADSKRFSTSSLDQLELDKLSLNQSQTLLEQAGLCCTGAFWECA